MNNYTGVYSFFAETPIWALALILYAVTLGVIHAGRDYLEGLPYQVAYSAQFGDAALIGAVLIAATILQRGGFVVPVKLAEVSIQIVFLVASIFLGVVVSFLTHESRSGQAMDTYHDVIVGPLILYLAVMLLPVIYFGGTKAEMATVFCLVLFWLALVVFDVKYKRMDQRSWLKEHGVTLKN